MRSADEAQHQAQLDQDGDDVATAHSRGHPPQEWRHRLKITQSKYLPVAKRQRSFENVSEACPNGGVYERALERVAAPGGAIPPAERQPLRPGPGSGLPTGGEPPP